MPSSVLALKRRLFAERFSSLLTNFPGIPYIAIYMAAVIYGIAARVVTLFLLLYQLDLCAGLPGTHAQLRN